MLHRPLNVTGPRDLRMRVVPPLRMKNLTGDNRIAVFHVSK